MSLPLPGAIARRAAADAQTPATLAIRETVGKNNFGKWIKVILAAVGLDQGNPWCLAFVILRLKKAAAELGLTLPKGMPITGYTPTFANWGKDKEYWIPVTTARAKPQTVCVGDLVFFYFASQGRIAHVGIVVAVYDWGVMTVEGNTGPDTGVSRDGGGVWLKKRNWAEIGSGGGFVRLPF